MIRINEITYIDDSLITHAEYQLFLDDMRMQGKYYYPSHWQANTFLPGQGRIPVMGVQPTAAIAFCEWLSDRSLGEWQYRLPYLGELQNNDLRMKSIGNNPIGYWVTKGKLTDFVWLLAPTNNHTKSVLDQLLTQDFLHPSGGLHNLVLELGRISDFDSFDGYSIHHRYGESQSDLAETLVSDLDRVRDLAQDHVRDLARAQAQIFALDRNQSLDRYQSLDHAGDLANTFVRDLNHVIANTRNLVDNYARIKTVDFDHESVRSFNKICEIANALIGELDLIRNYTRDLFHDFSRDIDSSYDYACELAFVIACDYALALARTSLIKTERPLAFDQTILTWLSTINELSEDGFSRTLEKDLFSLKIWASAEGLMEELSRIKFSHGVYELSQSLRPSQFERDLLRLLFLRLYLEYEKQLQMLNIDQTMSLWLQRNAEKDKKAIVLRQQIENLSSMYSDMLVLEARIKGKLPAYESIIIVKERKLST